MKIYDKNNLLILDVEVNDDSYVNDRIQEDHSLTLYYSLTDYVEIPEGSYVDFQGTRFTLENAQKFICQSNRNFEYTVIFEGPQAKLRKYMVRDTTIQNLLKFSYTAKPSKHIEMIVKNLNRRESGWMVGDYIETAEITLSYNHTHCIDALQMIADECHTEWEIKGKRIHLRRVEYNKANPVRLEYGKDCGLKPGLGRENFGTKKPCEILFVQGGRQNIDASSYGSVELLLPKSQTIGFDGIKFSDEPGFDPTNARSYQTDETGTEVIRTDKPLITYVEDSVDLSHIYPKRVGNVSQVIQIEENETTFYDIIDSSIPDNLNYNDYLIEGESMTIIFQTGNLAGREFDIKYIHEDRRFELAPTEYDGFPMPAGTVYIPSAGNEYAVFGCMLPDVYISDNATKSGASWEMFREAIRVKYENEVECFTFTGQLDELYADAHWLEIGSKIIKGGYVLLMSDKFADASGLLIRITGVRTPVNRPRRPQIELSNVAASGSISQQLNKIDQNEVVTEGLVERVRHQTKRTYEQAKEAQEMLEKALENFSPGIDPIWVRTMSVLIGNEYQQFEFVDSKTESQKEVIPAFEMNNNTRIFSAPNAILKHMTMGIENTSSAHKASDYKYWDVSGYTSPYLGDDTDAYYLVAKCTQSGTTGSFMFQKEYKYDPGDGFWYFLVGLLSSETSGERSFATAYGYTEILPGQMRIKMIISPDGKTFFNVAEGIISGNIRIQSGSTGYENLKDKPDLTVYVTSSDFSVLSDRITANVRQLTYVNGRLTTIENAGYITTAQGNTLYATKQLENGAYIVSTINQTPYYVTINANKIDLYGAVTYQMLNPGLRDDLDAKLESGEITLSDLNATLQNKINTMSSDIASKVNASALKAFSLNGGPGVSKTDFQAALQTEFNAKLTGSATTSGNKLADVIVNGQTLILGGYIQAEYINVDNLTVNKALSVGAFRADRWMLVGEANYDKNQNIHIYPLGITINHPYRWLVFGGGGESLDSQGFITVNCLRPPEYKFVHAFQSRFLPDTASERRMLLSFIALPGDAGWYYRTVFRMSTMPMLNHIASLPTIAGSFNSRIYNVLWDARTGCFYID